MRIGEQIQGASQHVKEGLKSTSYFLLSLLFKVMTGFFLGLTLGLVGQELLGYGSIGLIMMLLVCVAAFLKIASKWSIPQILIFDLICVLVGQILKMYILLAP